ncbi:MAG: leucyl aminopeptidase [Chromatiales bacterium]|nr:leucyl aminopeptidase [Chromatiales bacterium]HJP04880.1 leucyl aminopeptidase [Gammaproteobacteria bacterium]
MRFVVSTADAAGQKTELAVVAVFEEGQLGSPARSLDKKARGLISAVVDGGDIAGKAGELLLLTQTSGLPCKRILLVGCGARADFNRKAFRKVITGAIRWLSHKPYTNAVSFLAQEGVKGADAERLARITAESWHTTTYKFTEMKSKKDKGESALKSFGIAVKSSRVVTVARKGARQGNALGLGMCFSRDLANLPGNICTPRYLVKQARALARDTNRLACKVLGEAQMNKLGMGALLSVTAGSVEPAQFIILEYKGAAASKAPAVLVGKGITFDTGGISLKPPATMDEMKFDMSGAASVFGTFKAIAELQPTINVVGLIPTCENMPGGKATKPGDIVTSMSGQTIEVLNTDAEGRLILCDALTYARRYDPAALIDIATLTGACVIALGKHHSGLMSTSDRLAARLLTAGEKADDKAWRLPLTEEYAEQLKSNFADMANIGGREAGTITAACFLGKFTEGMEWAHLDIAGTSYRGGGSKGSTGRPVPLLLEFLLSR